MAPPLYYPKDHLHNILYDEASSSETSVTVYLGLTSENKLAVIGKDKLLG